MIFGLFGKKPAQQKPQQRKRSAPRRRSLMAAISDRLTGSWSTTPESADQIIASSLTATRARARDQYLNNDYAARFVAMLRRHVVGAQGIVVNPTPKNKTGKVSKAIQRQLEDLWSDWTRARNCDQFQRSSFAELSRLAISSVAVDGEAFVRLVPGGEYGLRLELIDPASILVEYREDLTNGNRIRFGIEYNQAGRVVAYHVNRSETTLIGYARGEFERVPADQMLHLFDPILVGQKRGIPLMASALVSLKHLAGLEEASLVAARSGASKMGFIYEDPALAEYTGEGLDENGDTLTDFEPGVIERLGKGERFEAFDPSFPTAFDEFIRQTLRKVSSGLDVSYLTLANDLSQVSYISGRHGAHEDQARYQQLQQFLIDQLVRPVYERLVEAALISGALSVPGATYTGTASGQPRVRRDDLNRIAAAQYQGRGWRELDPAKAATANARAIQSGTKSRQQIAREQGLDWQQILVELKAEADQLREAGLFVEGAQFDYAGAGQFQGKDPDELDLNDTNTEGDQ